VVTSGLANRGTGGSGCRLDGPGAVAFSFSAGCRAKASWSSMVGCVGYISGDDALLVGRDAKR